MTDGPVLIKRYPNRRYYARNTSKYVSLKEIEEMVQGRANHRDPRQSNRRRHDAIRVDADHHGASPGEDVAVSQRYVALHPPIKRCDVGVSRRLLSSLAYLS